MHNEVVDLNKKFKKALTDLSNIPNIKGKLDVVRQYVKFEFNKVTDELDGLGTFRLFLHEDFMFLYYWLGIESGPQLEGMFDHMRKSLRLFDMKLRTYQKRDPMIITYLRVKNDIPRVRLTLKNGYDMMELVEEMRHKYGEINVLVTASKQNSKSIDKNYIDYIKSFGFNAHGGTTMSNFEVIQQFVEENYS